MRLRELAGRIRDRMHRERLSVELSEELDHHRALLERDHAVGRTIGNLTYYREETRAMWSLGLFDDLLQDVRYATRVLLRDRAFTAAVVLTLALGIGANTAVFSIVHAVLLRPLPYRDPARLISVWTAPVSRPTDRNPTSLPDLRDWQKAATMLDGIGGYAFNRFDLSGPEGDDQARAILGTATLYETLGASPLLGRLPRSDEEEAPVVTISHRLWQQRFHGDRGVLGKSIVMNRQPFTIIGVMPPGFHFPSPDIDLWTTVHSIATLPNADGSSNPWITSRSLRGYRVVARLGAHVTAAQAERALNDIERRIGVTFPQSDAGTEIHVQSVRDDAVKGVARGLWTVFATTALILLLACVNVAHLLLERLTVRTRELAVRRALGAHRGRVLRQLMAESVLLGLLGGAAGIGFAHVVVRALLRLAPADIPRLETVGIDMSTLGFAVGASLLAAILFGVAPAFIGWGGDMYATLRAQGKGSDARGGRTRAFLMMLEVAFTVVILVGAGLMLRSFRELSSVDLGISPTNVVIAQVTLAGSRYRGPAEQARAVEHVLANVRAIPGVTVAGGSTSMPPSRMQQGEGFTVVGQPTPEPGREPTAIFIPATPGFLEALGIPLIRGRAIEARDDASVPAVVLISRELARRHFAQVDPIGHQILLGGVPNTIIGVVGDATYEGVGVPMSPVVYVPYAQSPFAGVWLAMRTTLAPTALTAALRDALHRVDPELPVRQPRALESMIAESIVRPRFNSWLLGTFGGLALVLASIGIYSVIAFAVTQRRAEIGIRLALGAPARSVVSGILRGGMLPVLVGLVAGFTIAFAGARLLSGLLYGIPPTDSVTFALVGVVLLATAFVAGFLPARRAARVDPVSAMRGD
jgi:putative ABC transport system permease protein